MANVTLDNMAAEIMLAVKEYTEDVTAAIEKEVDAQSKELVKAIRRDSPKKTSEYSKGWTRKKDSRPGVLRYIVYNKTKPGLAHLLEHGHAKRGGGRVEGRPHIRPNTERAEKQLVARIREIVRNGG